MGVDRDFKKNRVQNFKRTISGFYGVSIFVVILLSLSGSNGVLFLFTFAGLFLLVSFFDACVDAIAVRFSSKENRIGMVSFMNISYSVGTMLGSSVYLLVPKFGSADFFAFVLQISILGVVLLGLLTGVL